MLYWLYRHRDTSGPQRYAKDPVCGMQVEIAQAPATRTQDGAQLYFCSDHCAHRFDADPGKYLRPAAAHSGPAAALSEQPPEVVVLDPVCGMTVDPTTAVHRALVDGRDYFFCGSGCRTAFLADPSSYSGVGSSTMPSGPAVATIDSGEGGHGHH